MWPNFVTFSSSWKSWPSSNMTSDMPVIFVFFVAQTLWAAAPINLSRPCDNQRVQQLRSSELQKIARQDQADRQWQKQGLIPTRTMLEQMAARDLKRRKALVKFLAKAVLNPRRIRGRIHRLSARHNFGSLSSSLFMVQTSGRDGQKRNEEQCCDGSRSISGQSWA